MFSSKSKSTTQSNKNSAPMSSGSSNSIVTGTTIVGDIKANNDIRIDGMLEGTLTCQGRVIIGSTGMVDGKVDCTNAVIEGKFKGELKVKELLNVKESAEITGNIVTDKLLVQAGAVFNVNCSMGGQVIKPFENKEKKSQ